MESLTIVVDEEAYTDVDSRDEMTEIITLENGNKLYLGCQKNATNIENLEQLNVKTVFNVARGINYTHGTTAVVFRNDFNFYDNGTNETRDEFKSALSLLLEQIDDGLQEGSVLVHCQQGVSRSPSVVIGYLMLYMHMSLKDAYDHVQLLRSCVEPNQVFLEVLDEREIERDQKSSLPHGFLRRHYACYYK